MLEEKMLSVVITLLKRTFKSVIKCNEWRKMFQNSAKVILLCEHDDGSELGDKLNLLFSEDNIKNLAVATKNKNGFNIIEFIEEKLNQFFNDYDFDEYDIKNAIKIFIDEFKANLKSEYPEIYRQVLLNEIGKDIEDIKDNTRNTVSIMKELKDIENFVLKIPFIQENWLRNNSKYKIDLNFFDYDEGNIDTTIINAIDKQTSVYLKFKTKEEGLYYTLRLLKDKIENTDDVYVVLSIENWNKLINKCNNKILIPYFYDNNIVPILGNKVIYILSDEDNIVNKTVIEVPNRIRNNLYEKLNRYVKNSDETNRIINKTNGIFPALKRELFTGTFNKPEWITTNNSLLLPALLLSAWSENKNDKKFLEELSGESYNEYIIDLNQLTAQQKEGLTKNDVGREGFLERAWAWTRKYGNRISEQIKRLGCSCDWSREAFTMDEHCSKAVAHVFVDLYNKGLIYKGDRIINWCPSCKTALSDAEVEYEEQASHLWHIRYPFEDGSGYITVATTRPETILGDTAVAVNPKDERYAAAVGKNLVLPLVGRLIPVVADEYVEKDFGSGAVKITPAHDPNDFEVGLRHNLPVIRVMNDDGSLNELAGEKYCGLSREKAREVIVDDLREGGYLVKIEDYAHNVGQCYRCHFCRRGWKTGYNDSAGRN